MAITSPRGLEMLSYLPPYYETSHVMTSLLQVQGAEFDQLNLALNETLDQFFVETATWGLDAWEEELALAPDPGLTTEERRERILDLLRGSLTLTLARMKALIETFYGGVVHVIEDFAGYRVFIRFFDPPGIPANFSEIKTAVRDMLPAHLGPTYIFGCFTWNQWDAKLETWDDFDALGLTWDELEVRE